MDPALAPARVLSPAEVLDHVRQVSLAFSDTRLIQGPPQNLSRGADERFAPAVLHVARLFAQQYHARISATTPEHRLRGIAVQVAARTPLHRLRELGKAVRIGHEILCTRKASLSVTGHFPRLPAPAITKRPPRLPVCPDIPRVAGRSARRPRSLRRPSAKGETATADHYGDLGSLRYASRKRR